MKYNNAFNYIASHRSTVSPTDQYIANTLRDEALIKSYGLTTNYSSNNSYTASRSSAAQKACNALDAIKSSHIRNLNNKILSSLREVLPQEDFAKAQSKDIAIMSPSVLGHNPIMKKMKIVAPKLIEDYDKILSAVSNPIDAKKQSLLQLTQTDYSSAQHVEAQQKLFEQQFRVSEYFDYLNDVVQAPLCKEEIVALGDAMKEMYSIIQNEEASLDDPQPAAPLSGQEPPASPPRKQSQRREEEEKVKHDDKDGMARLAAAFPKEIEEIKKLALDTTPEEQEQIDKLLAEIASDSSSDKPLTQAAKDYIKAQLDELKDALGSRIDEMVTHQNALVNSFNQNHSLKLGDYYDGFVSTFNQEFASSQAVTTGTVKVDGEKSLAIKAVCLLVKFIPVAGDPLASTIEGAAEYKTVSAAKQRSAYMNKFGVTNIKLEKLANYMAKAISSKPEMKAYIDNYNMPEAKKILDKAMKFTKGTQAKFDTLINQLKDCTMSPQEMLGMQHAHHIINNFIYNGKFSELPRNPEDRLNAIVDLFINSLTDLPRIEEDAQDNQAEEPLGMMPPIARSDAMVEGARKQEEDRPQPQPPEQELVRPTAPVANQQEQELTPKSKKIKDMEEMMARMQAMMSEKDTRIQELESNPPANSDMISRSEIESIMQRNAQEMDAARQEAREEKEKSDAKDGVIAVEAKTIEDKDVALGQKDKIIEDRVV